MVGTDEAVSYEIITATGGEQVCTKCGKKIPKGELYAHWIVRKNYEPDRSYETQSLHRDCALEHVTVWIEALRTMGAQLISKNAMTTAKHLSNEKLW